MFNGVEYVREICRKNGIAISQLERDCGFSNGYLNPKKLNKIPYDRAVLIANYLGISASYIVTGQETEKVPAIQTDDGPLYLEGTYLRLAQRAQELGLDDEDVDNILAIYAKHKQKNQ